MTTSDDHYVPTRAYNEVLRQLANLPSHPDRLTQIIELLGSIGVFPLSCLADRDEAEMADADLAELRRRMPQPVSDENEAMLATYKPMLIDYHTALLERAKEEDAG